MDKWWKGYSWRMIQTNLREIDMADIKADVYVAQLKEFHASVAMINAAGIIASYPTKLECHFQSPYLTGDSLAQIIDACHKEGIRVMARTDFSKVRRPIYEKHPEWAYISPAGGIVDYNGDVHVCLNGGYQQDYSFKIIEELLTTLPFDGIFFNMGGYQTHDYSGNYHGICQCDSCRKKFAAMYSLPLPKKEDAADPAFRKYMLFKEKTLADFEDKVVSFIKSIRPEIMIDHAQRSGEGLVRQESNTEITRPLPHWQYNASDNTKRVVASYPGMVTSNTTVDFIGFPVRHVAVSPDQQELRLAQNMANGGALDYYLIGRLDNHEDKSGYEAVKRMFRFHEKNIDLYRGTHSAASIALVANRKNQDEYRGWFRILAENHFVFDSLSQGKVNAENLKRYKLVILPETDGFDDSQAAALDDFVSKGGTLVAAGKAGLVDARYEGLDAPAFKCLGVEKILKVRDDILGSYFRMDGVQGFSRSATTELIYFYGKYLYASYRPGVKPNLKMVAPPMFGPPERCYYTQVTDHPAFTESVHGAGKAFWFPWNPGSIFHRQGYVNTFLFIADFLEARAGVRPLDTDLPPSVELTRFEKDDGSKTIVHAVNASGHFGTSFYPPIELRDRYISVPCAKKPKDVSFAVREGTVPEWSWENGAARIRIDRLGLLEVVVIAY